MQLDSFDEVYEEIFPPIYRFVKMRIPKNDVDDVTAEIITKVWKALPGFSGKSALKTWVLSIARNHIVDYYRSRKNIPILDLSEAEAQAEDDYSERLATSMTVGQTLAQMSEPQVAVIQLRLMERFSAAETGEILGITQQAVDSLLYRAKRSFRRIYALENQEVAASD